MPVDRMTVLSTMIDQGVIPVFYHPDAEVCIKVIQACANGGAKCIEFTNRGEFAAHQIDEAEGHELARACLWIGEIRLSLVGAFDRANRAD